MDYSPNVRAYLDLVKRASDSRATRHSTSIMWKAVGERLKALTPAEQAELQPKKK